MVSRLSGRRKEWGMSLFVTFGNIGHAISPLLAVPVVTYFGFQALPLLIFPVMIVAFMLFRQLPQLETLPAPIQDFSRNGNSSNQRLLLSLHLIISTLRSLTITGFGTFIPVYMHSRGHSLFLAGATATLFQTIGAIGSLVSGHFATRVDRRRIICMSLFAAAPMLTGFIYLSGWPALLALGLSGILLYFSFPLNIVMAQELYPHRSSMVSALMIGVSWGTAGLLMTPVGFIAEKAGLQNALLALAVSEFVAAFFALFLPKEKSLWS
jgi:FSR family fosmidomycin resistance protein-like MFS transporter